MGRAAMALATIIAAGYSGGLDTPKVKLNRKEFKAVFTPEEIQRLSELSGKEKKNYVKSLKSKYESSEQEGE